MLDRIETSSIFESDLAPPYNAARRFWSIPKGETIDWASGILAASPDDIRVLLRPGLRVYLLIATTPNECVIGGVRNDVEKFVSQLKAPFVPLQGVTIAHCEVGQPVERPYRQLHTLPTTSVPGLKVYSGAYAQSYTPTPEVAADSITAGLLQTIDFPAVIRAAYRDGVRIFLEAGPGNSCTRMIAATLGQQRHIARSLSVRRQSELSQLLRMLAQLIAERVPVQLDALQAKSARIPKSPSSDSTLSLPVGQKRGAIPTFPAGSDSPLSVDDDLPVMGVFESMAPLPTEEPALVSPTLVAQVPGHDTPPIPIDDDDEPGPGSKLYTASTEPLTTPILAGSSWAIGLQPYLQATIDNQKATADAHEAYLRLQERSTQNAMETVKFQSQLVSQLLGHDDDVDDTPLPTSPPRSLTTEQCFTFARGRIGDVFGAMFAEIDNFPTRVRLPDGPLMLVDRILSIEGEPLSMKSGRVVTEHDVHAERWYLDAGRIPTCVAVEAGQADLLLSGFLGIDFKTKGLAVYRLLDAVVTFQGNLPGIGDTIHYDIHIDEFSKQADSWLFRFRFDATVNGVSLMTMRTGVAGFFSDNALSQGRGIVQTGLDRQQMDGKKPKDWHDYVPPQTGPLTSMRIDALRQGFLKEAFGEAFANINLRNPVKLPGGMMRLLDRVTECDPNGGRFGIGLIRAEADIHPDDWFLTCHFVDDMVMPGTLMYECCLHTLRVLLMRMGWVGEEGEVICEPVPGVSSRLKCRGQVLASTKVVTYQVSIKELGYGPDAFCIADALMYADGKPIVEITNMTLRMTGLTREKLDAIWASGGRKSPDSSSITSKESGDLRPPLAKSVVYDSASILAFSNGNPSEAFGEPYRVFDSERKIARLPGPPYQFLDRVMSVTGEPFVLKAGAKCETEYDVPADAWYFKEERSGAMPFSVLLEIALQPCGWLAAYCGSALTSDNDLSFRNLGGTATQQMEVTPDIGTLTVNVTMTNVSTSGGMIIQHYDMAVSANGQPVYTGTTYFGFFAKEALQHQVGMPTANVPKLTQAHRVKPLPEHAPFPDKMMRMVRTDRRV